MHKWLICLLDGINGTTKLDGLGIYLRYSEKQVAHKWNGSQYQ